MFDRYADFIRLSAPVDADAIARRLWALFEALGRRVEDARRAAARRRTARDLWRLDPHLLRDIGLTRDDLRRALRDSA